MTPTKGFLVWGAGGHGRVVADLLLTLGLQVDGFVDADEDRVGEVVPPFQCRVLLSERDLVSKKVFSADGLRVVPAIGENKIRLRCVDLLLNHCAAALIHPSASVSRFAELGVGTVVFAGAVVNAGAQVGRGCIINTGAVVEHDCVLGDGAHVSPGAVLAGGVHLGRLGWVGANATILPGVRIGDGATVGAGAVVRHDLEASVTVAGNPARVIQRKKS